MHKGHAALSVWHRLGDARKVAPVCLSNQDRSMCHFILCTVCTVDREGASCGTGVAQLPLPQAPVTLPTQT